MRAGPFARGWWMAQDGEAWRPRDVALDIGYMLPWVSQIWKSKGSRENGGIHKNAMNCHKPPILEGSNPISGDL